jgi:hypothetical protein
MRLMNTLFSTGTFNFKTFIGIKRRLIDTVKAGNVVIGVYRNFVIVPQIRLGLAPSSFLKIDI